MIDYKKIIKSRKLRFQILNMLSFVPDGMMLRFQYWIKLGRKPDLKHPKRYTEKLQWYKINYRNPVMRRCVDKYDVRSYVEEKGLAENLVECYGIYDNADEIDWDKLPKKFVMKKTNGGGGLNVVICKDKETLDMESTKALLQEWTVRDKACSMGREWAYYGLESRIIIEQYLENPDDPEAGICDYKLLCFNGKVHYIVLDVDRYTNHKRNIYDADWNYLDVSTDHETYGDCIEKPACLEEMKQVAEKLSEDFPAVRVDLYWVDGKIYFGELTFYPWSGYVQFTPDQFDLEVGEKFPLLRKR